ncbi:MAG: aminopeptidase P family protein [Bacteroidota bacterium]
MKRYIIIILILVVIIIQIIILKNMLTQKNYCVLPNKFIYEMTEPDFKPEVFENRRNKLLSETKDGVVIMSTAAAADFKYMTGFDERTGVACFRPDEENQFVMFLEPYNLHAAQWTGELYGLEGAVEKFGADKAYNIDSLLDVLPDLLKNTNRIYLHSKDKSIKNQLLEIYDIIGKAIDIKEIDPIIHEMRVIKDDWEISQIKQAVQVTAFAHQRVWKTVSPGQKEYEAQAEIEYVYRKNGLGVGFYSIVGSGPNATVLHHFKNNREMQSGDLLLVDIGASSRAGYSADITRTVPVNGKFSTEQKVLYKLVLKAFEEGVKELSPENKILDANHKANSIMVEGLYNMGLITDTTKWWQKRFYIQHRTSHYIGLNVHDVGSYGDFDIDNRDEHLLNPEFRGRDLKPGMVLSMEPGLYLMDNKLDQLHELFGDIATADELDEFADKVRPIYEKYSGIGIRIEDVVLITKDGNEILSGHLPKKMREIENFMK